MPHPLLMQKGVHCRFSLYAAVAVACYAATSHAKCSQQVHTDSSVFLLNTEYGNEAYSYGERSYIGHLSGTLQAGFYLGFFGWWV